jgi:hypothetical protein
MADNDGNIFGFEVLFEESGSGENNDYDNKVLIKEPISSVVSNDYDNKVLIKEPISSVENNNYDNKVELLGQIPIGGFTNDIIQRIWDTTVGWCQYSSSVVNTSPLSTETEPNHTDNLVVGTHQIIGEEL